MRVEVEENYARELSRIPSLVPDADTLERGFHLLQEALPETTFADGYRIGQHKFGSKNIIHFPNTGALITAASPDDGTGTSIVHKALALGINLYENPPEGSGLKPDVPVPFIHHDRLRRDQILRDRVIKHAMEFFGAKSVEEVKTYLDEQCPMGMLWLVSTVVDALERLNKQTGDKLLDEDGFIKPEYQERVLLINADSGAGEVQVQNDLIEGRIHSRTVTDMLVNIPTGFIAKLFGIHATQTTVGACAASGKAINLAESLAKSGDYDLFIVMSVYDGPTELTQNLFDVGGFPTSDRAAYRFDKGQGYTEAPAAVAQTFVTTRLAKELQLPIKNGRLIRTGIYQGINVYGVDKTIPRITYERAFGALQKYYPQKYDGTIVFATHGVNTMGWLLEIKALLELKKIYFPNAHFVITSTQPELGHSYAPRSSISLEILVESVESGILPGMVRAKEDLTLTGEEALQAIRRKILAELIQSEILLEEMDFGEGTVDKNARAQRKMEKLLSDLEASGITICYASTKIPRDVPIIAVHTGLGGESVWTLGIPIKEASRIGQFVETLRRSRRRKHPVHF